MKAKEILYRCRNGEMEVQQLQRRLSRMQRCGASEGAIREDVASCQASLDKRCRELDAEKIAACRIVDMLPDPTCGILYRYFVARQSQDCIVSALHIAVSTYKKHKRLGLEMAEQMDDMLIDSLLPEWYTGRSM